MIDWYFAAPRRAYALICLACVAMLFFGLYLQHVVGLEPCPMCIVQRYALILVALFAALGAFTSKKGMQVTGGVLLLLTALAGGYTAAQQSWLQWYPPEVVSCGRDFYGMIETFPLKRALPMIFRGGGDCSQIDWTFLKLSIANWSFIAFAVFAVLAVILLMSRSAPAAYSGRVSKAP